LNTTASTFTANTGIFGKVYFPRIIVPLSNVITGLISFGIQLLLLMLFVAYHCFFKGLAIHLNATLFLLPIFVLLVACLGLGAGLIVSSLTTKYRDLVYLVNFGVQLLMYATPVIYPLSLLKGTYRTLIAGNPLTPLIESFRYALFGVGSFNIAYVAYSVLFTGLVMLLGVIVFNRVEKSFMDVI
jgi:lipopolysaccharide transport system permease protein